MEPGRDGLALREPDRAPGCPPVRWDGSEYAGDRLRLFHPVKAGDERVGALHLEVDKAAGEITSLRFADRELLVSGPRLNVWRAPTDNDGIKAWGHQLGRPLGRWLEAGLQDLQLETVSTRVSRSRDESANVVIRQDRKSVV